MVKQPFLTDRVGGGGGSILGQNCVTSLLNDSLLLFPGHGESHQRSDPSRRSIRRQPRIGSTAERAERAERSRDKKEGNLSDAFDDDGLFHFEDTDASITEAKPARTKKK